mmetsp:Transcript_14542/g.31154  ORF Transcript_14542/g.31154 Transcript_14542/m.31154 type:complete len:261 (-) Transcript_14542:394-1176(-)
MLIMWVSRSARIPGVTMRSSRTFGSRKEALRGFFPRRTEKSSSFWISTATSFPFSFSGPSASSCTSSMWLPRCTIWPDMVGSSAASPLVRVPTVSPLTRICPPTALWRMPSTIVATRPWYWRHFLGAGVATSTGGCPTGPVCTAMRTRGPLKAPHSLSVVSSVTFWPHLASNSFTWACMQNRSASPGLWKARSCCPGSAALGTLSNPWCARPRDRMMSSYAATMRPQSVEESPSCSFAASSMESATMVTFWPTPVPGGLR